MFEETVGRLESAKSQFDSQVKDKFGSSVDEDVFEPIRSELESLENEYTLAEAKMAEINAITIELRTII